MSLWCPKLVFFADGLLCGLVQVALLGCHPEGENNTRGNVTRSPLAYSRVLHCWAREKRWFIFPSEKKTRDEPHHILPGGGAVFTKNDLETYCGGELSVVKKVWESDYRGGFRPGWQGSRTRSASSNRSDYRALDIKTVFFRFGTLSALYKQNDLVPKRKWQVYFVNIKHNNVNIRGNK